MTAFFRAIQSGEVGVVAEFLSVAPSLATTSGPHPYWGGRPTALHIAAEAGRVEIADLLLAAGADPNPSSDAYDGWTPLLIAIERQNAPLIELLRSRGARMDAWEAAALPDPAHLVTLLAADPLRVRARRTNDAPPLHFAATVDVARLLVDAGAPLDALDKYGSTAARAAAYAGSTRRAVARFLMSLTGERDACLYAALDDIDGLVALVSDGDDITSLVRNGIIPAGRSAEAPLHRAAAHGNVATARFLLANGASPNTPAEQNIRPLHYAAKGGSREVVDVLLAAGAETNSRDDAHHATPAEWASFFGHHALAEYLAAQS